jgi:hypothetical protein
MHLGRFSAITLVLPLFLACSDSEDTSGPAPLPPAGGAGAEAPPTDPSAPVDGVAGSTGEGQSPDIPLDGDEGAGDPLIGVEVPGSDCTPGPLPEFADLPENALLPNPFTMFDGTPVTTKEQWVCRHRELRAAFEKYETGAKTERPAEVTGAFADGTLTVNAPLAVPAPSRP